MFDGVGVASGLRCEAVGEPQWPTITEEQARELGVTRYWGHPCVKCGGTERYGGNGQCLACLGVQSKAKTCESALFKLMWSKIHWAPREGCISRADAEAQGLKFFKTGRACKRGHVDLRYTAGGACVPCMLDDKQAHREGNREQCRLDAAEWRKRNPGYSRRRWDKLSPEKKEKNRAAAREKYHNATPEQKAKRQEYNKEYWQKNKKKLSEYNMEWYKANKAHVKEYGRKRYLEKKDELAARGREWRIKNADAHRAYNRDWRKNNPDKARATDRNKRAVRRGAEGRHTAEDIQRIGDAQRWRCAWCRKPCKKAYEVDHIVALSRGGTNWPANLTIACPKCNNRKKAKDAVRFAREIGLLI